jgi:hypothetical protein
MEEREHEHELVRLMILDSESEANFLKGFFADHGIDAKVSGTESSALGADLDMPGPIELFVNPDDAKKAKELVEELLDDDEDDIPAWTCKCGEEVDEGFFVCWSCGAEYPLGDSESQTGQEPESE